MNRGFAGEMRLVSGVNGLKNLILSVNMCFVGYLILDVFLFVHLDEYQMSLMRTFRIIISVHYTLFILWLFA
jgi:hypothetical protein